MNEIKGSEWLAPDIKLFIISAPKIAVRRKAGQFVIVRLKEGGERIPLTIVDSDPAKGTITLIVQSVGKTTIELTRMNHNDSILDIVGPLGNPSEIRNFGTAICIGGGVGNAIAYPCAIALKKAGNHTISIIGARTKNLVILEDDLRKTVDEVYVTTDDGSCGRSGFVTDELKRLISERQIDYVIAIGPIPMMKAVAECTRTLGIKTVVSLNPIMIDGTGMCGGCRAQVNNQTVFVCVDGPEFDAHKVNFELLAKRNRTYENQEKTAIKAFSSGVCAK